MNTKENKRPLDQEKLSPDQAETITGGVQPAGINTACINIANFIDNVPHV